MTMSATSEVQKGQSTTKLPCFNDKYYCWQKERMQNFIIREYLKFWDIITQDPKIHHGTDDKGKKTTPIREINTMIENIRPTKRTPKIRC